MTKLQYHAFLRANNDAYNGSRDGLTETFEKINGWVIECCKSKDEPIKILILGCGNGINDYIPLKKNLETKNVKHIITVVDESDLLDYLQLDDVDAKYKEDIELYNSQTWAKNNNYDVIIAFFVLNHLTNWEQSIVKINELLKGEGYFFLTEFISDPFIKAIEKQSFDNKFGMFENFYDERRSKFHSYFNGTLLGSKLDNLKSFIERNNLFTIKCWADFDYQNTVNLSDRINKPYTPLFWGEKVNIGLKEDADIQEELTQDYQTYIEEFITTIPSEEITYKGELRAYSFIKTKPSDKTETNNISKIENAYHFFEYPDYKPDSNHKILLQFLLQQQLFLRETNFCTPLFWGLSTDREKVKVNIKDSKTSFLSLISSRNAIKTIQHYLTHLQIFRSNDLGKDESQQYSLAQVIFDESRSDFVWAFIDSGKNIKGQNNPFKCRVIKNRYFKTIIFEIPGKYIHSNLNLSKDLNLDALRLNNFIITDFVEQLEIPETQNCYYKENDIKQDIDNIKSEILTNLSQYFDFDNQHKNLLVKLSSRIQRFGLLTQLGCSIYITNELFKDGKDVISNGGFFLNENFSITDINKLGEDNSYITTRYRNLKDILNIYSRKTYLPEIASQFREAELRTKFHARKAANISILVDSFAHNVAAHSLAALSNYFAARKNELEKRVIKKDIKYHNPTAKAFLETEIKCLSKTAESEYKKLTGHDYTDGDKNKISISDIIKFGDTFRERLFYLKQPDYGTEDIYLPVPIDDSVFCLINYLSEKSEFWSAVIAGESFNNSITTLFTLLWGFVDNPLFVGTLAGSEKINKIIFVINNKEFALVDFSAVNEKKLSGNYQFVKPLGDFEEIKTCLSAKEVLLPGSNVGKQSVFTIFENCLRNIKHYDLSEHKDGKEVAFHLNIEEDSDNKHYSFEMYLGLTKYLNNKTAEGVIKVVEAQIKRGTFDEENSQPILGGTSQSILCANHLVTGKFSDEENGKGHFIVRNEDDLVKYTFKLWKGEKVKQLKSDDIITSDDNISRYKFLTVPDNKIAQVRENAIDAIRIIQTNETNVDNVYKEWLRGWLGMNDCNCEKVHANDSVVEIKVNGKMLAFGHGEETNNGLFFRNHGIFQRAIKDKWEELKYDVAEAMLIGVYTIDNRLHNVIEDKKNIKKIEDELHLFVKEENIESLNYNNIISIDEKNNFISDEINFLVIHLSFIESLNDEYKKDINAFIEKIKHATHGRENFHLVITTGRGRTDWKDKIKKENKSFVKHRSVLSLQNAFLDGVMKGDDFNLKYNFIKVLFGS